MKERASFKLREVKKYINFLLRNPAMLKNIANQCFEISRDSRIPAMQSLVRLPPEQSQPLIYNNLHSFLEKILNDTAFESIVASVDQWREDKYSNGLRTEVEVADIVRVYDTQIQLLLNNLTQYT